MTIINSLGFGIYNNKLYSIDMIVAYLSLTKQKPIQFDLDYESIKNFKEYVKPNNEDKERIKNANLNFPIIILQDEKNNMNAILDGVHRSVKAVKQGKKTLPAFIFDMKGIKSFEIKNEEKVMIFELIKKFADNFCK